MKIQIELTEECGQCYGVGNHLSDYSKKRPSKLITCVRCNGRGQVPTEFGLEVIDLIKTYLLAAKEKSNG